MKLWYQKPAEYWEEALPVGNGKLGAMVFSGTGEERIELNDDTLWSGYPRCYDLEGASAIYQKARELANNARYKEAQELLEREFLSGYTESYLPLGTLSMKLSDDRSATDYYRELDLENATVTVRYRRGDILYTRTVYVSTPAGVLVVAMTASGQGNLSFEASLSSPLESRLTVQSDRILLEGTAPSHVEPNYLSCDRPVVYEREPEKKGMRFCAVADIRITGGTITASGGRIQVREADRAVLYVSTETSFNGPFAQPYTEGREFLGPCAERVERAKARSEEELYEEHVNDYRSLYGRVFLYFEEGNGEKSTLPTDERLKGWNEDRDAALFALLYQYGRYLLISSSRQGTVPVNLQGIWNAEIRPPWSSNYTLNINTEMNYWPVDTANLSELYEPLLSFTKNLAVTGANTAKTHYAAGGFVAHHNSDIWCLSNPVGRGIRGGAVFAFWPLSAGWLSNIAYDHYLFTEDMGFLRKEAYPIIRGAARFFLDVLSEDEEGRLVFSPSTSPENPFVYRGSVLGVCRTTAMTMAIVRQTLQNAAECCERLDCRDAFYDELQQAIRRLPDYRTGKDGRLLEWNDDFNENEPQHRHISHLYPLYPGDGISLTDTPDLADACRRVLEKRGDESTGWALAWRVCLWAHLHDGEHAYRILKKQLRPILPGAGTDYTGGGGSYPNLFGAHPPFQIDSNFGAVAGITEMLLQSREDRIELLPALPEALGTGCVRGLRARGGYTVDLEFRDRRLISARIVNYKTKEAQLRLSDTEMPAGCAARDTGTESERSSRLEIRYREKTVCREVEPLETVILTGKDFE